MGNTYPNHKGNYYYRNHTLYHTGTLDPLGLWGLFRFHVSLGETALSTLSPRPFSGPNVTVGEYTAATLPRIHSSSGFILLRGNM